MNIPSVSEDDVGMFECQVTTCHDGTYTTTINITFMSESRVVSYTISQLHCNYVCISAYTCSQVHTDRHRHVHTHRLTQTYKPTQVDIQTHTHTQTRSHRYTHTQTHIDI